MAAYPKSLKERLYNLFLKSHKFRAFVKLFLIEDQKYEFAADVFSKDGSLSIEDEIKNASITIKYLSEVGKPFPQQIEGRIYGYVHAYVHEGKLYGDRYYGKRLYYSELDAKEALPFAYHKNAITVPVYIPTELPNNNSEK